MRESEKKLEEYADGLLGDAERAELDAALAEDPALREELERVRRFGALVGGLHDARAEERAVQRILAQVRGRGRRRGLIARLAVAAAAAALVAWIAAGLMRPSHDDTVKDQVARAWIRFGERLGEIAAERRQGRVPRRGVSDLEVPPTAASGIVFAASLPKLGVQVDEEVLDRLKGLVSDHFVALRALGTDLQAECKRAEASLALYRRLRGIAGSAVADAYYDVFRPGLAELRTAQRVRPGTLETVILRQLGPDAAARYGEAYRSALGTLQRRYGPGKLALVLNRLAPGDRRFLLRDASQDGVGRDAVLAIRARLYQAACDAGADRLYVDA